MIRSVRRMAVMPVLLATATCATPAAKPCPLAGEAPMQIVNLFFGRDVPGRAPVTQSEWADFAAHDLTPRFPDGFTVLEGQGQWQNPRTGDIGREPSWLLVAAVPTGTDLAARVDPVVAAYRARFHQESVGVLTGEACGRF